MTSTFRVLCDVSTARHLVTTKIRGNASCPRCGQEGHDDSTCTENEKCRNCEGTHRSNSRDCPVWKTEAEIQRIKAIHNIPHYEAKKRVESSQMPAAGPSYASVSAVGTSQASQSQPFKLPTKTIETQTLLSWPLDKEIEIIIKESNTSVGDELQEKSETNQESNDKKTENETEIITQTKTVNEPKETSTPTKRKRNCPPQRVSNRLPKGADNYLTLDNRFEPLSDLEDEEEMQKALKAFCRSSRSTSRSRSSRSRSPGSRSSRSMDRDVIRKAFES